jgi:hypothetical protein
VRHPHIPEAIQCQRHRGAWYPKSKGCSLCKAYELALKQGDELVARRARASADAARADVVGLEQVAADLEALRHAPLSWPAQFMAAVPT